MSEGALRVADSEKITINLGFVDLGRIELLVDDRFYANRTDFIRTAIRNQLDRHEDVVRQSVSRRTLDMGVRLITRTELEALKERGDTLHVKVLGLATIASDVSPELARATIASIRVLGALHASASIRAALSDRIS
ncbi:MAG: CopG family transcriptional regulator [Acetobacteraceae bacterium]|nr:CopG family transcriptional regulator [Acetobacteraceae bacterium]